ncbi:hypothetical protein MPSYJ_54140 [Mycolicibacterium psychrotolerans]|uniref:Uncharacterized protein n=1 Tax=Mycolicibacterium psychrotolerans TaxID=216929 RepID=A0A7I7MKC2_9MYCO|nr:hypothetical protein MPSYJ_54140 [Mycolicibacterium psychrotolerans]
MNAKPSVTVRQTTTVAQTATATQRAIRNRRARVGGDGTSVSCVSAIDDWSIADT